MDGFNIDPASGTVQQSGLSVCREGRCSFDLDGEHYELARFSAIFLRKGQVLSSFVCSDDFELNCIEAPAQFPVSKENSEEGGTDRRSVIFARFKDLLKNHYSREHDALFYARALHITPKYLTSISKELSGLSVKEWIDRALLRDASFMLRHTDKTIFQIAGSLHFESPELFGKFFKRMSSFSPRQFRIQCFETNKPI